ncbi:cysteine hydrolase [Hahella sp. CR1]|uniref:cysteine hydrolase family protein n=1 Tax=Hahella sp. CR1 TaxID=2992807 RepID=UPI002440F415|nr:cysteine hydrolase family protein [Hahella sp. CR1]MDG9666251.1 cysteine hydrolase [Hahella sp. CR1]
MTATNLPATSLPNTALLLIDIQNDYFPGGAMELHQSEQAAAKAASVLSGFRRAGLPVIHVQHEMVGDRGFFLPGTEGQKIHASVTPEADETVVVKNYPSSFLRTELDQLLEKQGVKHLVIVGMMTHMCVNTTVRAAAEHGYGVTLIGDATATRDLILDGESVPAAHVQKAMLASVIGFFAEVTTADSFLQQHNLI